MADIDTRSDAFDIEGDHTIDVAATAQVELLLRVRGSGNTLVLGEGVVLTRKGAPNGSITIEGTGNVVRLGAGTRFGGNLLVQGDGSTVDIGQGCTIHGYLAVQCSDATLTIGARTTVVQAAIQLHEPGTIALGEDCMVSSEVYILTSDIHPIYDRATGERINPAASVTIGSHVWLGLRALVMKGAHIGDGAVVAAGAVVSGAVGPHVIVAGVPARVVRHDVEWRRSFGEEPPIPRKGVASPPASIGLGAFLSAWRARRLSRSSRSDTGA